MKIGGINKKFDVAYQMRMWRLSVGLVAMLPYHAWANADIVSSASSDVPPPNLQLLSPEEISQRLYLAQQNEQAPSNSLAGVPVALIGQSQAPLGLDVQAITRLPTLDSVTAEAQTADSPTGIDPNAYIPEYQTTDNPNNDSQDSQIDVIKPPNVAKRLYNRLFNDGVANVPMLKVQFYDDVAYRSSRKLGDTTAETAPVTKTTDITRLSPLDKKNTKTAALRQHTSHLKRHDRPKCGGFSGGVAKNPTSGKNSQSGGGLL